MSYKATTFQATTPNPQTIDKFMVYIPGIFTSPLRVFATSIPQEFTNVSTINVTGVPFYLPSKSQVSGTWTCSFYESSLGDVQLQMSILRKNRGWLNSGKNSPYGFIEPIIMLCDSYTGMVPISLCVLEGAFIEKVSESRVDWSRPDQPLVWDVTFRYYKLRPIYTL